MTTIQDVVEAAEQLSPMEQLEIIQTLSRTLQRHYQQAAQPLTAGQNRILGLHTGKVIISDDFDDELPDAFWLGERDELAGGKVVFRGLRPQTPMVR